MLYYTKIPSFTQDGSPGIHSNVLFSTVHFLDAGPDRIYPSLQPYQTIESIFVDSSLMYTMPFGIASGISQSAYKKAIRQAAVFGQHVIT